MVSAADTHGTRGATAVNLPPWGDVKKLLEDPNVPDAHKKDLIMQARSNETSYSGGQDDPEKFTKDLEHYEKKLGASYDVSGDAVDNNTMQESFDEAKKAGEKESGYAKTVDENKGALQEISRKAEAGGAGCSNSNDILDKGKTFLEYFGNFSPLYKDVPGYMRKSPPKGDFTKEGVQKRYDEQRDINFENFKADAEDLRKAGKTQREQSQQMADKMKAVWGGWSGAASSASQKNFADINAGATTVGDYLYDTAEVITEATHHVSKDVVTKATKSLEAVPNCDTVGGLTSAQIRNIVDCAAKDPSDDQVDECCGYFGIDTSGCDIDDYKDKVIQKSIEWVQTTFVPDFEAKHKAIIEFCDTTKKSVDEHWKTLNDHLGKVQEDPFANPGRQGGGGDQGGGQQGGGQQGGGGAGGAAGGGAGGGGGAAGGGAGGGAGAGGAAGQMPAAPEMPKPPEMPQVPEMPQPPGMPGQGGPGGMGEKVTLGEGQNAVTVQEPGADGKPQVQLIGPDEQPKNYAVDFGQSAPGQMPGQPVPGGVQTMPAPAPGAPVPGGAQPIPVEAGPDGRAVIHEGNRTITLEQGPGGEIQVNVDNGGGQPPLNQTVNFGSEPQPPTLGAPSSPAGDGIVGGPYPAEPPMPAPGPGVPPAEPIVPPAAAPPVAPAPDLGGAGAAGGFTTMSAPDTSGFGTMPAADTTGAPAATTAQAAGLGAPASAPGGDSVQNSFGSMSGDLFGGPEPAPGAGSPGLSSLGGQDPANGSSQGAGSTGLSSLGGDPAPAGQSGGSQSGQGGSSAMGGGMMGGMMGGGQGGQQGGDQERTNSSPWRTQGQLFDDGVDASNVRFRSVLGEDKEQ